MSTAYYPGRQFVQEDMPDGDQHRREIARTVNLLMRGTTNGTLAVTLDPGVATTTVIDARISRQTAVLFVPMTANAAAEIAAGQMYVVPAQGAAVITHRNLPAVDRTFQAALVG